MEAKTKMNHITLSKEYYSTRMALTNSMHLFLLYNGKPNDTDIDIEPKADIENYAKELLLKFPQYLSISLISSIEAEKSLIDCFKDCRDSNDKDKNLTEADYLGVILAHPHLTDPQIALGVTPFSLYSLLMKYDSFYENDFDTEKEEQFKKIKAILDSFPVICFIKGTPQDPYCKFSRRFIELLNQCRIRYKAIDIFKDEKLRCYLRLYANWKTFPQLYINGKIIGGVDKLAELIEQGSFIGMVPNEMRIDLGIEAVKEMIKKEMVMIFIDNEEDSDVWKIADKHGLDYEMIDIRKDVMLGYVLRSEYSVNAFPAVFIGGKYVGGDEVIILMFPVRKH